MVQVCAHLWAMQQLLFWRAFPCSQDAQLLVHKHMPRAGFLYEYGRPAGAARARVNRDSRNELIATFGWLALAEARPRQK